MKPDLRNDNKAFQASSSITSIIMFILEWTTSLDTSSRTLFVREGGCRDVHVMLNVELCNYVISHQIVI